MPIIHIRRFKQKTSSSCGAACAQMILYFLKKGKYIQLDLLKEIQSVKIRDKNKWASSPQGLTKVLNNHKVPGKKEGKFNLYKNKSGMNLTQKMTGFISRFNVPCIALVETGAHWIVVNGYRTKSEIQPAANQGAPDQLIDLWVTDPTNLENPDPKFPVQGNIDLHH